VCIYHYEGWGGPHYPDVCCCCPWHWGSLSFGDLDPLLCILGILCLMTLPPSCWPWNLTVIHIPFICSSFTSFSFVAICCIFTFCYVHSFIVILFDSIPHWYWSICIDILIFCYSLIIEADIVLTMLLSSSSASFAVEIGTTNKQTEAQAASWLLSSFIIWPHSLIRALIVIHHSHCRCGLHFLPFPLCLASLQQVGGGPHICAHMLL